MKALPIGKLFHVGKLFLLKSIRSIFWLDVGTAQSQLNCRKSEISFDAKVSIIQRGKYNCGGCHDWHHTVSFLFCKKGWIWIGYHATPFCWLWKKRPPKIKYFDFDNTNKLIPRRANLSGTILLSTFLSFWSHQNNNTHKRGIECGGR